MENSNLVNLQKLFLDNEQLEFIPSRMNRNRIILRSLIF
jgi:Leucine-rich repeat (LRR) protein